MRVKVVVGVLLMGAALGGTQGMASAAEGEILIRGAKVVTMDSDHRVIPHGSVLIAGQEIAAVWERGRRPQSVSPGRLEAATEVQTPNDTLLFPGLINLHDHPSYSALHAWPAPSSDTIPEVGKAGTDPYDNRYEWNTDSTDEHNRLVRFPEAALDEPEALDLGGEAVKYAEAKAVRGGTTAIQGAAPNPESDGVLIRNIDSGVFGDRIAPPRVGRISSLGGGSLATLQAGMKAGMYDAWLVHIAEGVRDGDRRPGDPVSSRSEFGELDSRGLLSDVTVIVHGVGLERADFAAMRAAPSPRTDGIGDGLGAKLVWSPRSNLQLYGRTANVYEALAEDVLVSLGTDWTPSGSATLLGELKVADRALRDRRVLGRDRDLVPELTNQRRLDRTLVDMVTRNPAQTLRWEEWVGSVEVGKRADLVLVRDPAGKPADGMPDSPYRSLIDAQEKNVRLVMVDGEAVLGAVPRMRQLNGGDFEVVGKGAWQHGIDITEPGVPEGSETLAQLTTQLRLSLEALGGDNPPAAGGPAPDSNSYSFLKARWDHGAFAGASNAAFRAELESFFGLDSAGRLNIEAVQLKPLVDARDDFLGALLNGDVTGGGLLVDPTPPFAPYPVNLNHIGPGGNPLEGLP